MKTFTDIYILNLRGNIREKLVDLEVEIDENVFDIQQGVSITIFVKTASKNGPAKIHYSDLWGLRKEKYQWLDSNDIESTRWQELNPRTPNYLLLPTKYTYKEEYESFWDIRSIFVEFNSGIQTSRDKFVVGFDRSELQQRVSDFRNLMISDDEIRYRYNLNNNREWELITSRNVLSNEPNWKDFIQNYMYRPFDIRPIFYHEKMVDWPRTEIMEHMLAGNNIGLSIGRQGQATGSKTWDVVYCTNLMTDLNLFRRGGNQLIPLYFSSKLPQVIPNLHTDFIMACESRLKLRFIAKASKEIGTFSPEDILYYVYSILNSSKYREIYAEFLKRGYPRVPLTTSTTLFQQLSKLGGELVNWHLLNHTFLESTSSYITTYPIAGDSHVEKSSNSPCYINTQKRVYINKKQYFEGVAPDLWEFKIGGYQVLKKWLSDRKGRQLSFEDVQHYQRIVRALHETQRLMKKIDEAIGSFPLP